MIEKNKTNETAASTRHSPAPAGSTIARWWNGLSWWKVEWESEIGVGGTFLVSTRKDAIESLNARSKALGIIKYKLTYRWWAPLF